MVRKAAKKPRRAKPTRVNGDGVLDVTVVLLDGGYASTAVAPIEIFHSAGLLWNWLHGEQVEPRFRVRLASPDGRPVKVLCSLGLTPNCGLGDVKKADIIIVSASGWDIQEQIAKSSSLVPWLRKWSARGATIAGVCSGVAFLAEAGILNGKRATTHWGVAEMLRERYPRVHWQPEQFVTEDGTALCSGGVYASIDLSLYLVEKFCGHEIALRCAKSLLLSMPRSRQSGYAVTALSRPHTDERIAEIEEYLREHFRRDVSIEQLAERVGMGPRNFIRRFKAATGRVPGAYIQTLRITAAKEMLEQGTGSIQAVSSKIGYDDIAFFRSLFKRHTGMTPAEYRTNFAKLSFERGELSAA